ncbi:MAG: hypothetical protein ACKVLO_02365 [Pseudomonadales bacterium]|tara:strand:+ start:52 stop:357 length:306 start_codon:yes stop_codon:yes gene_type:complete
MKIWEVELRCKYDHTGYRRLIRDDSELLEKAKTWIASCLKDQLDSVIELNDDGLLDVEVKTIRRNTELMTKKVLAANNIDQLVRMDFYDHQEIIIHERVIF